MGCKASTLSPHQVRESAAAEPSAAPCVSSVTPTPAAGASSVPCPAGDETSSKNSKPQSLRLRLASMKPVKSAFTSPRLSLAHGYDKLRKGASSLCHAITPGTTPGATPRSDEHSVEAGDSPHSIATNAIKEADNPACLDVEEAKSQAVAGTMHTTGFAERGDKEKLGETEEEVEMINRDQPTEKQLKAVWLLMKVNAATSPQQTMRWLHDLEWLLVSIDPLERQQPTRSTLVEAKAIEMCLKNFTSSPDDLQLCVSSLAVLVHLSLAKEASARIMHLGGIDITAKLLKKYFNRCKKLLKDIPLMTVEQAVGAPEPEAEQQSQQQPPAIVIDLPKLEPEDAVEGGATATLESAAADAEEKPRSPSPTPERESPAGTAGEKAAAEAAAETSEKAEGASVGGNSLPVEELAAKGPAQGESATPSETADRDLAKAAAAPVPAPKDTLDTPAADSPTANSPAAHSESAHLGGAAEKSAPIDAAAGTVEEEETTPAAEATPAEIIKPQGGNGGQMGALKRACSKLQQQLPLLLQQKLGSYENIALVTQEQFDAATKELKLVLELITLVWRLIFATSLDGDEFAQRWVSTGAPDLAVEALASPQAPFRESAFVCWALGALRFLPLAVPSVSEVYVHSKSLLHVAFSRMELHPRDHLVLENGFAVLANYQRKQPQNSRLFSKQRPDAWGKCVAWLLEDESLSRIDVLFQGLFAIGLACSYCPLAVKRVRQAGGLVLTERILTAHDEMLREPSISSTTDSKIATLQQFAEGLKVLLLKSQVEEEAEKAEDSQAAEVTAGDAKNVEKMVVPEIVVDKEEHKEEGGEALSNLQQAGEQQEPEEKQLNADTPKADTGAASPVHVEEAPEVAAKTKINETEKQREEETEEDRANEESAAAEID